MAIFRKILEFFTLQVSEFAKLFLIKQESS